VRSTLQRTARAFPTSGAGAGVAACTAPTSTAQDSECYCTTSTCGAGMLDAGAAVTAASLSPSINASATSVTPGTVVTLDGSGSQAFGGATISSYQWAITGVSNIAGLSSTNAATTTLTTTGVGTVIVTLTITDNSGRQASTSATITVAAAPAPSGGGGGGAFDPLWLAGLLLAALVLSWSRLRPARTRQSLSRARRPSGR
jgi:serine protease